MAERLKLRERISMPANVDDALDEVKGILRGVKVLGLVSQNGRDYTKKAVKDALPLIEGARVYINHPSKNDEEEGGRPFEARFGRLREARVDANGEAWADLHYNPHHAQAKSFVWHARNDPKDVGMSINGDGRGRRQDNGRKLVEQITKIDSVDLVDGPGTVNGLMEQGGSMDDVTDPAAPAMPEATPAGGDDWRTKLADLAHHAVSDPDSSKGDILKKLKGIVELLESESEPEDETVEPKEPGEEDKAMEQLKTFRHPLVKWAVGIVSERLKERRVSKLRERARTAKVPERAITDTFLNSLYSAPESEVEKLLEDRRATTTGVGIARSSPAGVPPTTPATPAKSKTAEELAAELFARDED